MSFRYSLLDDRAEFLEAALVAAECKPHDIRPHVGFADLEFLRFLLGHPPKRTQFGPECYP